MIDFTLDDYPLLVAPLNPSRSRYFYYVNNLLWRTAVWLCCIIVG